MKYGLLLGMLGLGIGIYAFSRTARAADVVVYTAPWCGVCPELKEFLAERGVDYLERNVDANQAAARDLEALTRKHGMDEMVVPTIVIRGEVVFGFQRDQLIGLLPEVGEVIEPEPEVEIDPETGEPVPEPGEEGPGFDPGEGPPPDFPVPEPEPEEEEEEEPEEEPEEEFEPEEEEEAEPGRFEPGGTKDDWGVSVTNEIVREGQWVGARGVADWRVYLKPGSPDTWFYVYKNPAGGGAKAGFATEADAVKALHGELGRRFGARRATLMEV